ncbi:hypothetical protein IHQ71_03250 [Rhizobium sp. TH2]|uniref:DUF6880 family protein n=1 Tax=Rhizobium sp. TH2 TaxID=2775403 RepID=UPI00215710B6|nr:DUF6880 family protein [Rhizobium sp. TH2]UVC09652.1 hypothetical protein IHQ71_03250 [Rhizobium sp. TH2]
MPKSAKAKLDQAGLTGLGLEKLVEILLDEVAFNKALKSRLLAALAGGAGAGEVARLIDSKLDSLQKSRAYLSPTRANTLSVELRGLLRNITSELASLDRYAAFERVLRFLDVGAVIEERARNGGARLAKLMDEGRDSLVEAALKLDVDEQVRSVTSLEKARVGDDDGNLREPLLDILCGLGKSAADAWKAILTGKLKGPTEKAAHWRNTEPVAYLQTLALHTADIDAYIELEQLKPQERRDNHLIARMLHEAKRYPEALEWVRKPAATMRLTHADNAATAPAQPPRLLEADILDALKQKGDAQAIRWTEFERTLRPDILRNYISKLDDFAEFEETDKAFAIVAASPRIHEALDFLVKWPRLDLASEHVLRHLGKWDGRQSGILVEAADAFLDDYPVAATMLYRILLDDILRRGISDAYGDGATFYVVLHELQPRLGAGFTYQNHRDYMARLRERYGRKPGFWQLIPRELV